MTPTPELMAALRTACEQHLPNCPDCLLVVEGSKQTRIRCCGCGAVVRPQ